MARGKNGASIGGYFRQVFRANRKLLKNRSNDELWEKWKADHPGEELTKRIQGIAANVKSNMRHKPGYAKRGPKPKAEGEAEVAPRPARVTSPAHLEKLEVHIDECLSMARQLDEESMRDIVKHLRVARNGVVRAGSPS